MNNDFSKSIYDNEMQIQEQVKNAEKNLKDINIQSIIKKLLETNDDSSNYQEELRQYNNEFNQNLPKFYDSYVKYKKTASMVNGGYGLQESLQQIQKINTNVDTTKKNIETDTNKINALIAIINGVLGIEKSNRGLLNEQLEDTGKVINGSQEFIYDYVDKYKRLRLVNIGLWVAVTYLFIFVCWLTYSTIRKPKTILPQAASKLMSTK